MLICIDGKLDEPPLHKLHVLVRTQDDRWSHVPEVLWYLVGSMCLVEGLKWVGDRFDLVLGVFGWGTSWWVRSLERIFSLDVGRPGSSESSGRG